MVLNRLPYFWWVNNAVTQAGTTVKHSYPAQIVLFWCGPHILATRIPAVLQGLKRATAIASQWPTRAAETL